MQMEFTLKNTHATGADVKELLEEKTARIKHYFDGRLHARWTISYEHDEHISHFHVTGSNMDYFGEGRDHNLLLSIDDALEKVDRQLQRHKEIVKDQHNR